jgi:peptidoglycan hydrolase FlgJ
MENTFNIFINPIYDKNTVYTSIKESKEDILNTAKKVEGLFLNIILKNMRNSLPKNDLFNNETKSMYEDIYDQTMSQNISEKGFGLADIITAQILKKNNQ